MLRAAWVEGRGTLRTGAITAEVLVYRKLKSARATQDRRFIKLDRRPNVRFMIGDRLVTIEARIPTSAASELYRDHVKRRIPMATTSLRIDLDTVNLASVNNPHE